MAYRMISVWAFSYGGLSAAQSVLAQGGTMADAVEAAAVWVEDDPSTRSVGYGGRPNAAGIVELDASFMNGSDLSFGAVSAVSAVRNPVKVARRLSRDRLSCYLTGPGAEQFAQKEGFAFRNNLIPEAPAAAVPDADGQQDHDTVCVIGRDGGHLFEAVTTSGLAGKRPGRVGDSPVVGSGFYCDDTAGAAACTGVGEDAMRGCLSFAIVEAMRGGLDPQQACETVLEKHYRRLAESGVNADELSVIAMDPQGRIGAATTRSQDFPFTVMDEQGAVIRMVCRKQENGMLIRGAAE
jgi:isoaspartyl peptidase/L-asparaginase-like protein (Ntn-hydrolase superfamily)